MTPELTAELRKRMRQDMLDALNRAAESVPDLDTLVIITLQDGEVCQAAFTVSRDVLAEVTESAYWALQEQLDASDGAPSDASGVVRTSNYTRNS